MSACGTTWPALLGKGDHACAIHTPSRCMCICGCIFEPTQEPGDPS